MKKNYFQNLKKEAREMAQKVKVLPQNLVDLSSIPCSHGKAGYNCKSLYPSTGEVGIGAFL